VGALEWVLPLDVVVLPILLALFVYLLDYLSELFRLEEADIRRCVLAGVNKNISTDDRRNIAQ